MFAKFLCVLICCAAFCEMKPFSSITEDMEIIVRCNSSSPVDKRELNLALIERRFEGKVSENFKCFLQCLYHNYRWMDGSGRFRHLAIRSGLSESTLSDSQIDHLLNTCTRIVSEDRCERAFEFTTCFWVENSKLEDMSTSMEWQMSRW